MEYDFKEIQQCLKAQYRLEKFNLFVILKLKENHWHQTINIISADCEDVYVYIDR